MKSKTHQNSFQITELSALRIMKKVYKNATSHEYVEKRTCRKGDCEILKSKKNTK